MRVVLLCCCDSASAQWGPPPSYMPTQYPTTQNPGANYVGTKPSTDDFEVSGEIFQYLGGTPPVVIRDTFQLQTLTNPGSSTTYNIGPATPRPGRTYKHKFRFIPANGCQGPPTAWQNLPDYATP